ncbi:iron complex transport system ATP-binding protein [Paucibacter oligotrophus]|uniref:Iron complex transport system ATP-binding protein n=1 Tax=Roseateles oligotrophus TaxID=1769250 RepID=A0A840LKB5_9BURK|nr:ATP-binding cassette domain-containing protein [Roseateles oligotrophus]MBB4845727.1 iron complex transport system ATP-binding protein [Roseateles oligotrophus]
MISVHQLSQRHGGRTVLSGVNAEFPPGRMSALIGPNGAGKSTLLMLMARLQQPWGGEIRLAGRPVADIPLAEYARQVATLRQSPGLSLRLRVEELVAFGRFPHGRGRLGPADHQAIAAALDFLSLTPLRQAYLDELSGGQRQLAALAMCIAQQTPLLLLDEPLNHLDMKHGLQIMRALRRLCDEQGRTVVLVIHDINFAANYADHIVALKDGALHCSGPAEQVASEACLCELYEIDFEILRRERVRLCNYFKPQGA